jgi:hypothetical protein
MALEVRQIADKVEALKRRNADRDTRMANVLSVRRGQISNVYPDFFPEGMTQPMIANFIDVAARDLAEVLAPLPSFNCTTFNVTSDRAKAQAEKRSMIVNYYAHSSRLQTQMYTGADWYLTYGFLPIVVEIDVESNQPRIRLDNPLGAYPEFDRFNRLVSYTRRYYKTLAELIVEFPEYESQLVGPNGRDNVDLYAMVEMVKYEDAEQILLFVPQKSNLVLKRTPNPIGEMMVRVARRPSIDDDMRGQFDDVVWVQLARARFSLLALEAAEKSVQAPLALPNDVQELAFGPDAVLRSQNPQQIRRVGLELPNAAFTEQAVLQQEMRLGARYPEGRTGNIDASIITGQGVQALLGAFDSQIKAGQQVIAQTFEDVLSLCMRIDEKIFPMDKTVRGVNDGAPYELKYNPAKDIKGDYTVEVRYGLMAGLDPSRALIFSLQAMGGDLVSREFVMSELPWALNVSKEQERIDVQRMRDNLNKAIESSAAALPEMIATGQSPAKLILQLSEIITARQNGTSIEEAAKKVFAEPEPTPVEGLPQQVVAQPSPTSAPAPSTGATPPQAPNIAQILGQIAG